MKRILQIALIVGSMGPLFIGLSGFADGAAGFIASGDSPLALDAHLRALSIWFTVVFFIVIWAVRNLETAGPVLYIMFTVMALAGVARMFSMWTAGISEPRVIIAASVEIATLIYIPWHVVYMRSVNGSRSSGKRSVAV